MTRENWLCRWERDAVSRLNTVTVVVGRMRENGASFSLAVYGSLLSNIKNGDFIFCHIAGVGFAGIGICMNTIVPMEEFIVIENGDQRRLMDCDWLDERAKELIDPNTEYVLAVKWLRTVSTDFSYWERGMTYQKVLHHFKFTIV